MVDVFVGVNYCVARVGLLLIDCAFPVVLRQFETLCMSVQTVNDIGKTESAIWEGCLCLELTFASLASSGVRGRPRDGSGTGGCSWTNPAPSFSCKRFIESIVCQIAGVTRRIEGLDFEMKYLVLYSVGICFHHLLNTGMSRNLKHTASK